MKQFTIIIKKIEQLIFFNRNNINLTLSEDAERLYHLYLYEIYIFQSRGNLELQSWVKSSGDMVLKIAALYYIYDIDIKNKWNPEIPKDYINAAISIVAHSYYKLIEIMSQADKFYTNKNLRKVKICLNKWHFSKEPKNYFTLRDLSRNVRLKKNILEPLLHQLIEEEIIFPIDTSINHDHFGRPCSQRFAINELKFHNTSSFPQ